VGISVAKTNSPSTIQIRDGIADYAKAFRAFEGIGDYATINISCPNAFGGEPFTDPTSLDLLLTEIDTIPTNKPIFLKVPADSTTEQLDALVAIADRHRVHGFVIANLTKTYTRPEIQPDEIQQARCGGVSGKATFACSNALIAHLYRTAGTRYVIIGCGGIFSAEDAYEKIRQGASLVQLITGMIFEGPQLIGEINRGLVRLLTRDGFSSIRDAIGSAHQS
jgi:dihydroorotate dehydrogenase